MKNIIYLLVILSVVACNKSEKSKKQEKFSNNISQESEVLNIDSDGDGIFDHEEINKGGDPFIADIPTFEGQFFQHINVSIDFYNKTNNLYENLSWLISNGEISLSWENEERAMAAGGLYMESLLKHYATRDGFTKNYYKFFDYNDGVFSHSAPVMFEDGSFAISKKVLDLQRRGFEINRADVRILSKFNIRSKQHEFFSDPSFQLYFKMRNSEGLIPLKDIIHRGTTFEFNQDNTINLEYWTEDPQIIADAFINGGASFFLKLNDFTIYETKERYTEILEKVKAKSIPVTITMPSDKKGESAKVETIYVGLGSSGGSLREILNRGLKKDFLMSDSSVDQVRGMSNRIRSYGDTGKNETLKWFIGTSALNDNIFNFNYSPGDGIGLAYISDKRVEKKPIYTQRGFVTNSRPNFRTTILPSESRNLKIRITPESFVVPSVESRTVKGRCSGDLVSGEIIFHDTYLAWRNSPADFFKNSSEFHLLVNNNSDALISGKISDLIKNGLIHLSKDPKGKFIDLILIKGILPESYYSPTNIVASLSVNPVTFDAAIGRRTMVSNTCRRDPPDLGGCKRCRSSIQNVQKQLDQIVDPGRIEKVAHQHDLNIHVFAY